MFIAVVFIIIPNWKQSTINRRVVKHITVHPYNGIPHSNKKDQTLSTHQQCRSISK